MVRHVSTNGVKNTMICIKCGRVDPSCGFYTNKRQCKDCRTADRRQCRKNRTPEQVERDKENDRQRRKNRTPEEVERIRELKRRWRKNQTSEELARISERQRQRRKNRTPEKKERDAECERRRWASLTSENKKRQAERQRQRRWLITYGLMESDYKVLLYKHSGCCHVCGKKPAGTKEFHVDHDHKTGRVRGLLCQHCNIALGMVHDDPTILLRMIEYLKAAT